MQDVISKQQIIGAGIFTPTTDTGCSDTITISPRGSSPTLTIIRAELAAVLVAVRYRKATLKLLQTVPHQSFRLENSY